MIHILLIEDSEDDAILMSHVLRHNGFTPEIRRVDTPEALEAALDEREWEVILTDYNLPRFSGLDALKVIAGRGLDTPVIAVSGAVGEEMAATLMRAGAKDFVRKDNMARLLPAIERELKDAADRRARRQAERERAEGEARERKALAQVEAARQLDALKNQFVNAISHELRNPLTSVLGYVEMLDDELGGPLTDEQRDFLKRMLVGTRRLQRLVDDLLDFAKLEAGTFKLRPEPLDFRSVASDVVDTMQPQADLSGISLTLSLPPEPLAATVDGQRMEQVLANLVGNALKFTPEGGTVHVSCRAVDGRLRCDVADTGVGIAEADMPLLFHLFSQLEAGARQGGTGLGLAISKNLVEAHGGHITVRSRVGEGSTFTFEVPTVPPADAGQYTGAGHGTGEG